MTASEAKLPKRGAVRSQLVGHNEVRRKRVPFQQLAKKLHGRGLVASPLNKHIQHLTLAIDGTPQIHALAIDRYDHFIEVPLTIRSGPRMSQISRDRRTELQDPESSDRSSAAFTTNIAESNIWYAQRPTDGRIIRALLAVGSSLR